MTDAEARDPGLVIIDASVAVKAVLPNPLQRHCLGLVGTFAQVQPIAPALWRYETTSAIAKAIHFGQLTEAEGRRALVQLEGLDVRLFVPDSDQNRSAFDWTLRLNRASAYDSFYLALAQALESAFWTADKRLFNALEGVHLDWLHWIEEVTPIDP